MPGSSLPGIFLQGLVNSEDRNSGDSILNRLDPFATVKPEWNDRNRRHPITNRTTAMSRQTVVQHGSMQVPG